MNTAMKLGLAALSLNALVLGASVVRSQQIISGVASSNNIQLYNAAGTSGLRFVTAGQLTVGAPISPNPQGAIYHQVVDVYYDTDGNKLETRSATHAINEYCQSGVRRQEDLVAQDDGRGNVKFASVRLPGEPATGIKPVTAEGRIKAMMAIKASPSEAPTTIATDAPATLASR